MNWIRMDVESVVGGGWTIHNAGQDAEAARLTLAALASAGGLGSYTAMVAGAVSAASAALERHAMAYLRQTIDMIQRAIRLLESESASGVIGGVGLGAPATAYASLYPSTMTIGGHTQPDFFISNASSGYEPGVMTIGGHSMSVVNTYQPGVMTIGGHTQPDFYLGGSRNGEGLGPTSITIGGATGAYDDPILKLAALGPQGAAVAAGLLQSQANMVDRILLPTGSTTTRGPGMLEVADIAGTKYYR